MARYRFVRPETVRLSISDGDWLLVKKRLTAGEQRAAYARMYLAGADGTLKLNPLEAGLGLMTAYLIDWSCIDDTGAVEPIRGLSVDELASVLSGLSFEDFAEIRDAIEAHHAAMHEERAQEKKATTGKTPSGATSSSPSGAAGALIGSAA